MAKRIVIVSGTSIDELIREIEVVGEFSPDIIKECMLAQVEVGKTATKQNWSTMGYGKINDLVYDSISCVVALGNANPNIVYGSYGVYSTDSIASSHGKTDKDISAAQLGWWAEYGTRQLAPVPFLTNAHIRSFQEQERAFETTFNTIIDGRLNNGG